MNTLLKAMASSAQRNSYDSNSLRPNSMEVDGGLSPNIAPSPSDMVGPSPVTSNGTETTDIEDDASEEIESTMSASSVDQEEDKEQRPNSGSVRLAL